MRSLNKKAQSTAEYAIVIALVLGAAIAMQTYTKRGLQGGIKFVTDKLKSNATGATGQYEPYYLMRQTETKRENVLSSEELKQDGEVVREMGNLGNATETTTRGYKQVMRNVTDQD